MVGSCYLFQFGQSQRVVVFDFELHKAHVCWVCELRDDTKSWEQSAGNKETIMNRKKISHYMRLQSKFEQSRPEECLDIDDSLCIRHVILLCNHGALLVNHHHGVGESHSTSQQTVQTVERVRQGCMIIKNKFK